MPREGYETHLGGECPLVEVSCEYQRFGCPARFLRKDFEEHLTTCSYEKMKGYLIGQEKLVEDLRAVIGQAQEKVQATEEVVGFLKEQNKGLEVDRERLIMESEATRREIDALHEELRNQDAFRTGEMIRAREEIEGVRSFVQVLQMQVARLMLEVPSSGSPGGSSKASEPRKRTGIPAVSGNPKAETRKTGIAGELPKQGNKL